MNEIQWLSDWRDDLMWCPSQLYREFKRNGKEWTLYCRWRYEDPWTFNIYPEEGNWEFIGNGLTQDDPIEKVHEFAEKLLGDHLGTTEDEQTDGKIRSKSVTVCGHDYDCDCQRYVTLEDAEKLEQKIEKLIG